jgi:hypothetical protein
VITGDDIRQAIGVGTQEPAARTSVRLNEQLAEEILGEMESGKDFWEAVYEPYSQNRISREVVKLVIERSKAVAGKGMPQIARHLKAVKGDITGDEVERKRFFRFKNFLYKTVRI